VSPPHQIGARVALVSIGVSATLAAVKIVCGLLAHSTSVVADGVESASDVLASSVVFFGLSLGARPPDQDHPYGHGRLETVGGLVVGMILALTGVGICVGSFSRIDQQHAPPAAYAIWPLIGSIAVKSVLSSVKFRSGRRIGSASLTADAWNDTVDILSGAVALCALGLTLWQPERFLAADHVGGFCVGLIVVFLGLRVVRETTMQLMDTMPDERTMEQIRAVALSVPGALGVEKCFARKTGLRYHVDLHLEVDEGLTVRESHEIATQVRIRIKEELDWVADVLVHVEPHGQLSPNLL
jgi:cation diffusion facilitator family transporter